ncbi:hypothetical protein MD484_g6417, partial [Candolleomyces efflorescens]
MNGPPKRKKTDENAPLQVLAYDPHQPKRQRTKLIELTPDVRAENARRYAALQQTREQQEATEIIRKDVERRVEDERQLSDALKSLKELGYSTLFSFMKAVYTTKNQHMSSQVTQMVSKHAPELLDLIQQRDNTASTAAWIKDNFAKILASEVDFICSRLRPTRGGDVSEVLREFSLDRVLKEATTNAPNLSEIVSGLLGHQEGEISKKKKDVVCPICLFTPRNKADSSDKVLAAVLSIIAQCKNEKSSRVQTVTGIFLFACGASRALFDVLNHAGFCLSYVQTIEKMKTLSEERLKAARELVRNQPCCLVYDNINIAFRVGEQREGSKDHFDNGTTATLVPLFDVAPGELPLSMLPKRCTRRVTQDFNPLVDLLPSIDQLNEVEQCMLPLLWLFPPLPQKIANLGNGWSRA